MKRIDLNATGFERQIFKEIKSMIQTEHCLHDINALGFEYYIDEYTKKVRSRLELAHYERHVETKELTIEFDRPKFLDWLLRRRKTKTVRVELKEVLKESNALITQNPFIEIMAIKSVVKIFISSLSLFFGFLQQDCGDYYAAGQH